MVLETVLEFGSIWKSVLMNRKEETAVNIVIGLSGSYLNCDKTVILPFLSSIHATAGA